MLKKKKHLDDILLVALAVDKGQPLGEALNQMGVTYPDYFINLSSNLNSDLILTANGSEREQIRSVLMDEERTTRLFEVSDELLASQYQEILDKRRKIFVRGLFSHTTPYLNGFSTNHEIKKGEKIMHYKNIESALYIGLTHSKHHPDLASTDRTVAIKEINALDSDGRTLFKRVMLSSVFDGLNRSYLRALQLFDKKRSEKLGQKGLFDLTDPIHMCEWDLPGDVPQGYWMDEKKLGFAAYYLFGKADKAFAEKDNDVVRKKVNSITPGFLRANGLYHAMCVLWSYDISPLPTIVKAYDAERQRVQNVPSLFSE